MQGSIWQIEEAQMHFLELADLAMNTGPQTIVRDGQAMVTVVASAEWDRISDDKSDLNPVASDNKTFDLQYGQMRSFICG